MDSRRGTRTKNIKPGFRDLIFLIVQELHQLTPLRRPSSPDCDFTTTTSSIPSNIAAYSCRDADTRGLDNDFAPGHDCDTASKVRITTSPSLALGGSANSSSNSLATSKSAIRRLLLQHHFFAILDDFIDSAAWPASASTPSYPLS